MVTFTGNWWDLRDILRDRHEFTNSTGNFRGMLWNESAPPTVGRMPTEEISYMRQQFDRHGFLYVVYSYETLIAWLCGDGQWYVTDNGYSMTTKSKHLSRLRPAISELTA